MLLCSHLRTEKKKKTPNGQIVSHQFSCTPEQSSRFMEIWKVDFSLSDTQPKITKPSKKQENETHGEDHHYKPTQNWQRY